MSTTSRRWRTSLAVIIASLALPLAAVPTAASASPHAGDNTTKKIDRSVRDQVAAKGYAEFWVVLDSEPDLSGATRMKSKTDKARHVRTTKVSHAEKTQAGLRAELKRAGAEFTSYWIDNSLLVTGDAALLERIAARPEVAEIEADEPVALPEPLTGVEEPAVDGIEWNVDRVNAPRVWTELGVRGEGTVVANIDSGVKHDHPAVADAYRGKAADGTVDHNYHWFDPASICAGGTPCDNNGHGTHTMGTMVGDDGAGNQIGVAPGAKWIAAKGCESNSCSRASLLASGQWIVAPTDLSGGNPRPDLAPDVVNNSWGANVYDPWYTDTVQSWISAGIFPAFSNGNSGPNCNTSGSPGTYQISYSSGAFDINNTIASFSSRGTGENGEIKPNLAAPGVNVRSSTPSGYSSFSGTSMASPHTAATVALMWSASPAIAGDIAATKQLLDDTAADVDNTSCGGTADDNNVFGEGRLDAYAAVNATPRGALGGLSGHVSSDGAAVSGATVSVDGPMGRTVTTGADGSYAFSRLMVGDYTVSVRKFGYLTGTGTVTVVEAETATRDFVLQAAPSATLSGVVRLSSGAVAAGATVDVLSTPVSATTDADGRYQVTLPHGDYQLKVDHANRCASAVTESVSVTGDTTHDVTLPQREDGFGYACGGADGEYVPGTELVALTGDDRVAPVELPFRVPLYGKGYRKAYLSTNGWVAFASTTASIPGNRSIPSTGTPNAAIMPFWDDLYVDAEAGIYTSVTGEKPNRVFLVEWRNVSFYSERTARISFTAAISENGGIVYRYAGIDGTGREAGEFASIGLENAGGTVGFEYTYNSAAVASGESLRFAADAGVAIGTVTDANDGDPVAGAAVTVRSGDSVVDTAVTGADGDYLLQVPSGAYQVTVAAEHYEEATSAVTVATAAVVEHATVLRTARVEASAPTLEIVTPSGEDRRRTVTLTNTGGLGTDYTVVEADESGTETDVDWLTVGSGSGSLAPDAAAPFTVTVDASALAAHSYQRAQVLVRSASGRQPTVAIPVTIVAPGYQASLDTGGRGAGADSDGDSWTTDQPYAPGSCGYVGESHQVSTKKGIAGTADDARYRSLREGMTEYRFDGLADGVYTVELEFAELRTQSAGSRLFDVHLEGVEVARRLDVAGEVGALSALRRTYTVTVTDGQLNVRFFTYRGFGLPIVNAIRVTDRPDLAA
ncbi:MAG: S8 family serine peptidase [Micromonosporaceae bacterium]